LKFYKFIKFQLLSYFKIKLSGFWTAIFFCSDLQYHTLNQCALDLGASTDHLYWYKPSKKSTPGLRYTSTVENIIVMYFGEKRDAQHFVFSSEENRENHLDFPAVKSFYNFESKVVNYSQKPVELLQQLINHHSRSGDYIMDLFSGSGSTAIAALKSKRNVLSVEKDPFQVSAIKSRIVNLQKEQQDISDSQKVNSTIPTKSINSNSPSCYQCKVVSDNLVMCAAECGNLGHPACSDVAEEYAEALVALLDKELYFCTPKCFSTYMKY
jgi:hypothetical protein